MKKSKFVLNRTNQLRGGSVILLAKSKERFIDLFVRCDNGSNLVV